MEFPIFSGARYIDWRGTNSYGMDITAHSSANTKGAYVELVSSANNTTGADGFFLWYARNSFGGYFLVDIAIGAAGSEVNIIDNLTVSDFESTGFIPIPLRIPPNIRVSARCQCSSSGSVVMNNMAIYAMRGGFPFSPIYSKATTYGVNTSTSLGTTVQTGFSANTKGSTVEITASTTSYAKCILLNVHLNSAGAHLYRADVRTGSSGNEVSILPDFSLASNPTSSVEGPKYMLFPLSLPAGTRLSARIQTDAASNRTAYFSVITFC